MRILLVEDEKSIRDTVVLNLQMEGFEVVAISDGKQAFSTFRDQHFDLLLLDVMLPGIDGFKICEQIRLTDTKTPIIFLTAKDNTNDRLQGLRLGADDYLQKPFHLEELLLRIRNVLKRTNTEVEESFHHFKFDKYWIDFKNYTALTKQGETHLTKKEAMLLKLLIDRKNEVVSRQEILQSVWGYHVFPSTRTIDNFILSFRKYFEDNPKDPKYFISIRGVGYRFEYQGD